MDEKLLFLSACLIIFLFLKDILMVIIALFVIGFCLSSIFGTNFKSTYY